MQSEPSQNQTLSQMVNDAFLGMRISLNDTKPALRRQLVWDAFSDEDVERVIEQLGMTAASSEVGAQERADSHRRVESLAPINNIISSIIDNLAQAQTAAMVGAQEDEIPDVAKHQILHFNHRIIFSSLISALATMNELGYINLKAENGK